MSDQSNETVIPLKPEKKQAQKLVLVEIHADSFFDCVEIGDGLKLVKGEPVEFTQAEAEELLKVKRDGKNICRIVKEAK